MTKEELIEKICNQIELLAMKYDWTIDKQYLRTIISHAIENSIKM